MESGHETGTPRRTWLAKIGRQQISIGNQLTRINGGTDLRTSSFVVYVSVAPSIVVVTPSGILHCRQRKEGWGDLELVGRGGKVRPGSICGLRLPQITVRGKPACLLEHPWRASPCGSKPRRLLHVQGGTPGLVIVRPRKDVGR